MRADIATVLPRLYLGTMTFGWRGQTSSFVDEAVATKMVESFRDFRCATSRDGDGDGDESAVVRIDTARIYSGGDSEAMLGTVLSKSAAAATAPSAFAVGTKAHPSQPDGLSPSGLRSQLRSSLDAVGTSSVSEYYLHQPDPDRPLLDSLRCLHGLVEEGLIGAVGMSNYHASEVRRAFELCDEHGLTKPSVYQGLYNPLHRTVEEELLPVLKEWGCSFVAYNPLAGGMLTGKHLSENPSAAREGRFRSNPNYLPRFYTGPNFRAADLIRRACDESDCGLSMVEASYRWMLHHSALDGAGGDGLLLGASSSEQLRQNLDACRGGGGGGSGGAPLPESVVRAFDEAWDVVRGEGEPFPYWRSYSSDMPGREDLDPGASYNAAKKKP